MLSAPGPERAAACASVSVVSTPNAIGTPVSPAAAMTPCATAEEMYSKCGVSPRITQPRQTIASNRPVSAAARAACGSSNAPGTVQVLDVGVGGAGLAQRRARAVTQRGGDALVEAGGDDGEAKAGGRGQRRRWTRLQ